MMPGRDSITRRLAALEDRFAPVDDAAMTDDDRRWFLGLSESSISATIRQFAGVLAERRYLHEGGLPAGARSSWAGDWRECVPENERERWIEAELDRFTAMAAETGDQALDDWLETADREGWPALGGPTFSMDRLGFEAMLTRWRQGIDVSRGCEMPGSDLWRRAHPAWRPGMTGGDALAFEIELSEEADRRDAEAFGSDGGMRT